jgi:hypothetical protein
MDRSVRRKLAMAASARTFSRAHPSADAGYMLVLDRLDGAIVRMEQLAEDQQGGHAVKHSSVVWRQDIRRRLHFGVLRHLVTVAKDVGTENPALAEKFRLPNISATHAGFRASVMKMLDEARANQGILVRHGLSAAMLDEFEVAVGSFDSSLQESDDGKQAHVAARAAMRALGHEITRLVGILDGFNRHRFHHDPGLIVAWESAKHVVSGPQVKDAGAPAPIGPRSTGLESAA